MGLRNHLILLPKDLSEAIRECVNKNELIELLEEKRPEAIEKFPDISESDPEVSFFRLGEEIYDLGPISNIGSEIKNSIPLFGNEALQREYEPICSPKIVFAEGYLEILDSVRKQIEEQYHNCLKILLDSKKDKIPALMSFLRLREDTWKLSSAKLDISMLPPQDRKQFDEVMLPYNIDLKTEKLVNSGSYEYQIFEMVRIYKTLDFDRFDLLLIQW